MDGWTNEWMDEWMDGWTNGWMDGQMNGWTDRRMDVDEWMVGWKDGCGYVNGWGTSMDQWMDVDRQCKQPYNLKTNL